MISENLGRMFLLIFLFTPGKVIGDYVLASDFETQSVLTPSVPLCFSEGTTWSTEESTGMISGVEDLYECQELCLESSSCYEFTWYNQQATPLMFTCFFYNHTTTGYPCTNCISGPQSCACNLPEPQEHGNWFCPPSSESEICHLECHPGYVSNNGTIITCQHGAWSSSPTCVAAVGLITGNSWPYPYNTVEIYGQGLHKKLPNLPDERELHTIDVVNSDVLICGGEITETSCLVLTSSQQWMSHSTTTSRRSDHSSVSMLGNLHLLGGYNSQSTTESLTPPSNQWSPSWDLIETHHRGCAAKIDPQVLIVTGGWDHPSNVVSYNVTSGAAIRLQNVITARVYHGCVYVRDPATGRRGVMVVGGTWGGSSSEIYDLESGEWSTTGQLTSGRYNGVRMVVLGDNILAMGGHDGINSISTVDQYNMTSRQWKSTDNMMEARQYHAVTGVSPVAVGLDQN